MTPILSYLKAIASIHKQVLAGPINRLQASDNPSIAVAAANMKLRFKGTKLLVSYDGDSNLFAINDGEKKHYFGNLLRGLNVYKRGLSKRSEKLFNSYFLNTINFAKSDLVIDCGANYGDLWLALKNKIDPSCYVTFEPGILEHSAITHNAPNGAHNRLGLSNKEGEVTFYVNEKDADSSVVEPSHFTHVISIQTVTLSSYVEANKISRIKLLKLEAEGFEPEILEGAKPVLDKIEYIALDGGYERGVKQEETFSAANNILLSAGFEMVSINFEWGRGLFRNKNFHH